MFRIGIPKKRLEQDKFINAPCNSHWDVVICILRYIKNALRQGLLYEDKGSTKITYYFDVDWARSPLDEDPLLGLICAS